MKVFISWSGDLSKQVANLLGTWIGDVLQGTETWISSDDIDKGSLWFGDITKQLAETSVGILCLTRENITAPWVLFEAGALSKGLSTSRVCPLLVNLSHTDLKPPLSQFNGTLPKKEDILKLILTINSQNRDKVLSDDKVQRAFDRCWGEFDSKFSTILKGYKPAKEGHKRPMEDVIEEILDISRSLQKVLQQSPPEAKEFIFGEPRMNESLRLPQNCLGGSWDKETMRGLWLDFISKEPKSEKQPEKNDPKKGRAANKIKECT